MDTSRKLLNIIFVKFSWITTHCCIYIYILHLYYLLLGIKYMYKDLTPLMDSTKTLIILIMLLQFYIYNIIYIYVIILVIYYI